MNNTQLPQFELVGPSCEISGCDGVLVDWINFKTNEYFQQCSKCGSEFNRMPTAEKLELDKRTIGCLLK